MSSVPAELTAIHRDELAARFSKADAEWIVLGVAMMGFLNKFMDALGVELEEVTAGEVRGVIAPSGWSPGKHFTGALPHGAPPRSDGAMTKLGVVRHAPGALSLDRQWTAGVPGAWPAVGQYLQQRTGHDFPVLGRLRHKRAVRALATMLRDNLDAGASVISIPRKLAAAIAFTRVVGNPELEAELGRLGPVEKDAAVDALAQAIATSPARVDAVVVDRCRGLPPVAIVEVVTFVSLMQLVHRLETYYPASGRQSST
jgi:hypothetical protein